MKTYQSRACWQANNPVKVPNPFESGCADAQHKAKEATADGSLRAARSASPRPIRNTATTSAYTFSEMAFACVKSSR